MIRSSGKSKSRKPLIITLIIFAAILLAGAAYLSTLLPIITGYAAKNMGSAVFISGRMPAEVDTTDLNFSFIKFTRNKVNYGDSSVTSRFLWGRSRAIDREDLGVTLVRKSREENLRAVKFPELPPPPYNSDTLPWPMGDQIPDTLTGIDSDALNIISRKVIDENGYGGNVFAFMVLHKGIPVAEAYKPQFTEETRFLSWSMAKSFMNALTGVLVKENGLDIYAPAGIEEWMNDERKNITINDLMRMQSGLEWNEDYGSRSDVNIMLFCRNDMAAYVRDRKAEHPAGTYWSYSSGSSNVVSYLIRKHFPDDSLYYIFPHLRLFYRIGITDAVFETDPAGTYIGSSYLYATARDYARFALLYQQDGIFNGERILPEGWVSYTREPVPASKGEYGSLFWLYGNGEVPSAPEDLFMCVGHDGQRIFIMPSKELIVVILGYSPRGSIDFDMLIRDIVGTV
ncbi:MAG: serine hydrolase [Bacteroidales bacterium]|nr:serine hydrolase [Bacteroidales bacterium]MBN2634306.1 serine hydrolase [Bacteroidales bacterium]